MILDIVQYGHPVLRERCKPVEQVDDDLRKLAGAGALLTLVGFAAWWSYRARERRTLERERAAEPGVGPEEAEPM